MKFYIADAFTTKLFGGNPAGVVLLDEGAPFPSEETMIKTAAELRYSETAFVKRLDPSQFQLRYFTPAAEVDLCGHATIGTFASLLDSGLVKNGCSYVAKTRAGNLAIQVEGDFVMMEMASPKTIGTICEPDALKGLSSVMGFSWEPVSAPASGGQPVELLPLIISTGLPDIILPVRDRETLDAIHPDFDALAQLSEHYQVTGVHAFALDCESPDVTARCRNFAPLYDIDEEAATGTASGALTYYLFSCQLISSSGKCTFIQGESMDRPSRIVTHLQETGDAPRIQVGGAGAILASGDIRL